MARCTECFHYEVCAKECRMVQIYEHTWDDYNQLDNVEKFCANYIPAADVVPKSEVARLEQDVTRLVQENEDLKDSNEHLAVMLEETKIELEAMRGAANPYKMHYDNAMREVARLTAERDAMHQDVNAAEEYAFLMRKEKDALIKTYKECTAEVIKEFAERLKIYYRNIDKTAGALINYTIDQKLKEFLGERGGKENG